MQTVSLEEIAAAVANGLRCTNPLVCCELIRSLAAGAPVSLDQLATTLQLPGEQVTAAVQRVPDIEFDAAGRVIGFGLTLVPTIHRFAIADQALFTWCAFDTLMYPALLGKPAQVASICPISGASITFRVTPEGLMGCSQPGRSCRMEEAARLVGLRYIVNLVSDAAGQIAGCFVGDPVLAHRAGCELSRATNAVTLPRRADVVVIDSYPADRDFWQSATGLSAGTMAVRDGGMLILVAPNPEGVAENHPTLLQIGYRPYPEVVRMVEAGEIDDVVGAAILADLAQIVDRADCIMVSPGVGRAEAERLGCRYAGSVQEALRMAFERQGRSASVAVLGHGGHILPLIAGEGSPAADGGGEHEA